MTNSEKELMVELNKCIHSFESGHCIKIKRPNGIALLDKLTLNVTLPHGIGNINSGFINSIRKEVEECLEKGLLLKTDEGENTCLVCYEKYDSSFEVCNVCCRKEQSSESKNV